MSRERKYQQGKFENYYPERNELRPGLVSQDEGRSDDRGLVRERHDQSGSHKGKGPRNYERKDERILEDINDRLCDNPYLDASEVEVSVSRGDVVVSGSVENREAKRLVEDIGESVSGVKNVENRLRVKKMGI